MSSGFPGGGADFYGSGGITGRSIAMNNAQASYRSQLPGILLDPSSQIPHRRPDLIGKRTLAEFQTQNQYYLHQQQQQQGLGLLLRSVKPRTYHQTSPISPLSPMDFSGTIPPEIASVSHSPAASGRYGLPLIQQARQYHANNGVPSCNASLSGVSYSNLSNFAPTRVPTPDSEPDRATKMMNTLHELEKQLLDDAEDGDGGDDVSVITNSEWSEAIQNLMVAPTNSNTFVSPSPTTSTTSSSSSSSVASSPPQSSPKQSLVDAASAMAEGNAEKALEILTRVTQVPGVNGSADQQVGSYVASALRWRVSPTEYHAPPVLELYGGEHAASLQVLYELSPCFKFGLWAANHAILEATSDLPDVIHVIDFDAVHAGSNVQYLNLVQALAARQNGKPVVLTITSVAEHGSGDWDDEKLRKIGERVGVCVKLRAVTQALCDLSRDSLGCGPEEAVVVNLAFKLYRMPDESVRTDNPRDELLRRVKGLRPRVVTVVEQEMNCNTAPFTARVSEVCAYYGALFDSLDSTMARDNPERVRVEEALGRKMANSVACEGKDRVERCEMFGKWRARLGMAGFEPIPLSQNVAELFQSRVNSRTRGNMGFAVKEETGGICFRWMGRTLTVASAWR
ncbi:scarecrow-like protein 8 [Malania oleifera]|uniref:scarecrow-like protein 8 n=1 Tax=Malania oleifera TaxID=397392 RepID=UPI0025AE2EB6|nr:scarecrow-like protein 8 [Malania oleifera]